MCLWCCGVCVLHVESHLTSSLSVAPYRCYSVRSHPLTFLASTEAQQRHSYLSLLPHDLSRMVRGILVVVMLTFTQLHSYLKCHLPIDLGKPTRYSMDEVSCIATDVVLFRGNVQAIPSVRALSIYSNTLVWESAMLPLAASSLMCVTSDGSLVVASDHVLVMQVRFNWVSYSRFYVHNRACASVCVCASYEKCVRAFAFLQCVHCTHY